MKLSGRARFYDRLTPEERFRLDVLATARGDEEESELLLRTCQRETYTMNHRGFTGRWAGAYEITLRMYIAINHELAKLQMIDAFRELVPYSQTLSHNIAFDAYFSGHESGSRHAWGEAQYRSNITAQRYRGCPFVNVSASTRRSAISAKGSANTVQRVRPEPLQRECR